MQSVNLSLVLELNYPVLFNQLLQRAEKENSLWYTGFAQGFVFCISNKEAQTHTLAVSQHEVFYELRYSCVDKPALVFLVLKGSLLLGFGLKPSKCCPEKLKTL